ncbi:MAG: DUF424 family protein [Candidatus Woesearchaeota archaeon]|nr:MAG: DUF424 family protein [Candidatus Woesearchaeota archaeon]
MMYYKVYEREWGKMVAVCDQDICNKTLKDRDIEFFVNPRFYQGNEGDEEKVISLLKEAASANLVGEEAVKCGVEAGLIDSRNVIKIKEVPHAQAVVMNF